jgi:hypothetical protein
MGVGCRRHATAVLPLGKKGGTHGAGGWMGVQGQSERERKISPPPGFDPRKAERVASRYTDYTILAHGLRSSQR